MWFVALLGIVGLLAGPSSAQSSVVLQANADPCTQLAIEPLPFPGPGSAAAVASALGDALPAVRVEVRGGNYDYHYLVDGQPVVIRGMGYNPQYAGLGADERSALHGRDFAAMAASGVNTVWGWNPAEFDGLTLDLAHAYGLGVALPYDFDWRLDFTDPSVRAAVRTDVLDWVARYRDHPAPRLWAIGNETFHKLVPPAWCRVPPTAEQAALARALAGFYVELIDAVHALDPDHPVIFRASEDSYISWLAEALRPGGPRPWFVYGVNVYTPRLADVLREWPNQGLDTALLVSEFGPGPEARPAGYREYWQVIRSHARSVLGGVVYVWFAEGPEEIDRVYGLVNPDGWAVDGALEVIRQVFSDDAPDAGMR